MSRDVPPERSLAALYVCYLGLDDPLVQTQVVAYLRGLSAGGHTIHLATFEKGRLHRRRRRDLTQRMARQGISWHGLRYHKRPSLPATVYDVLTGALASAYLIRRHRLDVLHARSHMPAAMALVARRLCSFQLLFDIRGLMAEEYADAGTWKQGSLPFRLTKRVEAVAIREAAGAVVLTERVRRLLFADDDERVQVIPCCVDIEQVEACGSQRSAVREQLGLGERPILIYVGKFAGWYMQSEMVEFFALAHEALPDLHFLVLSQSDHEVIFAEFERLALPSDTWTITRAAPEDVGAYLAAADAAIAFIRPCHSKLSSSPTKIGEYLAAGLPVITGPEIGDVDALIAEYDCGVVLDSFDASELERGVVALRSRMTDAAQPAKCRRAAESLSLDRVGVSRYRDLYQRIATGSAVPPQRPGRASQREANRLVG
jgi:glycosyltransferase involved in cell wall biosynthesis